MNEGLLSRLGEPMNTGPGRQTAVTAAAVVLAAAPDRRLATQTVSSTPAGSQRGGRVGFTLVELLVVIAIIALLVSMLLPNLSRMMELTRQTQCATNLKSLGSAWAGYFTDYKSRTPHMFNPLPGVTDCYSQFNILLFCCAAAYVDGRYEGTVWRPDYVNAGMLYKTKMLSDEQAFVCPTVERNSGGAWFNPNNPWPVSNTHHTQMTYGTRRMKNYDEPALAYEQDHYDPKDDHVMIWSAGVASIPRPSTFSFMADNFRMPSVALKSHVPGVNVLYLDGHVRFWRDQTGQVLYNNGLPPDSWDPEWNWQHDDIWMIIDGYHKPPVGSGNK